ncbi:MAG: sulfurtransferase TusA family protein, partial [Kordiimonadaceae bacterium]|nr:sulfurtransferase TusA family protein [Kordiimonadaceae bacterium]
GNFCVASKDPTGRPISAAKKRAVKLTYKDKPIISIKSRLKETIKYKDWIKYPEFSVIFLFYTLRGTKLIAKSSLVNLIVTLWKRIMTSIKADHKLDVSGHKCPIPVLRLRRLMENIKIGNMVELKATDLMTLIDIPNFCREAGHDVYEVTEQDDYILYFIKKC